MSNKVRNMTAFIRRVPNAMRRLDQLTMSKDEKVSLGAVKLIFDKVYANPHSVELSGRDGEPIQFIGKWKE